MRYLVCNPCAIRVQKWQNKLFENAKKSLLAKYFLQQRKQEKYDIPEKVLKKATKKPQTGKLVAFLFW